MPGNCSALSWFPVLRSSDEVWVSWYLEYVELTKLPGTAISSALALETPSMSHHPPFSHISLGAGNDMASHFIYSLSLSSLKSKSFTEKQRIILGGGAVACWKTTGGQGDCWLGCAVLLSLGPIPKSWGFCFFFFFWVLLLRTKSLCVVCVGIQISQGYFSSISVADSEVQRGRSKEVPVPFHFYVWAVWENPENSRAKFSKPFLLIVPSSFPLKYIWVLTDFVWFIFVLSSDISVQRN